MRPCDPIKFLLSPGCRKTLIDAKRARCVVDLVEQRLWTPLGLRTLDPAEPGYSPHYIGGPKERDPAYHQGTVWPWLAGPFIEAWVRVRGDSPQVRSQARTEVPAAAARRVCKSPDSDTFPKSPTAIAPHTPRGCPFQAWSLGGIDSRPTCSTAQKPLTSVAVGTPRADWFAKLPRRLWNESGDVGSIPKVVEPNRLCVRGSKTHSGEGSNMETRQFGKTDMRRDRLGFGGAEIGFEHASAQRCLLSVGHRAG